MEAKSITAIEKNALCKHPLSLFLFIFFLVTCTSFNAAAVNVRLAWDPSPEPLVTGYRLYYGPSSGNYTNVVDAGNGTDCTVTGLDGGTTYYFAATAYTATGGESAFSNVASLTTPGSAPSSSGSPGSGGGGGGCFIAAAAWGSEFAPEVIALREFRDRWLLTNRPGRAFVEWYYRVSPDIAAFIAEHESLRIAVRWGLAPVIYAVQYPGAAAFLLLSMTALAIVWYRRRTHGR